RLHLTILNRRNIGPCKESWRRFCTLHTVPAVRQVVFADVQITIRQRVAVLLLAYTKLTLPLIGCYRKACREYRYENNRTT
ncbi:MAG: hypothetical protein ACK55Z_29055, partial [bacterium]